MTRREKDCHLPPMSASGSGRCALPAVSRIAQAQVYPTRPVRLMVGFTAGPTDFAAAWRCACSIVQETAYLYGELGFFPWR
jgi:hypothetical protein